MKPGAPDRSLSRQAKRDILRGEIALHVTAVVLQMQTALNYLESARASDNYYRRTLHAARESMRAALNVDKKLQDQCADDELATEAAIEFRTQRHRNRR